VADLVKGHACWLGRREWRVTGQSGYELGRRLWQTFLEAGGPWPTEFRLVAYPAGAEPEVLEAPGPEVRLRYVRRGPGSLQVWDLTDPRERPGM
jgi:hypothetical protein